MRFLTLRSTGRCAIKPRSAGDLHVMPQSRIRGFGDEALSGEWKGHRSCRLGLQWRVIYRTEPDQRLFQVNSIIAHDYRRP